MDKLEKIIRLRRTDKVLADPDAPSAPAGLSRQAVDAMLETAACAPLHYPAAAPHRDGALGSVAPYRVYKLDAAACRGVLAWLKTSDLQPGKIAHMLAGAETLLLFTWLPEPEAPAPEGDAAYHGSLTNMEHIAAGSAAIQNLLLLAAEAGLRSYWSSGGVLRGPEVFERLAIPPAQILLGAVFLFPAEIGAAEVMPGKLRDKRGTLGDWSAWRDVD